MRRAGLTLVSMAGEGWHCAPDGTSCGREDALAPGASYPPLTVTANVGNTASTPQVNAVAVTVIGVAATDTTDSTTIIPNPPVLSITKTHTGDFKQAQNGATYSVTVSNQAGTTPTIGTVTVTETVPSGFTLVSMAGNRAGRVWPAKPPAPGATRSILAPRATRLSP